MTHIYVGNLTIIGSDNGLSPGRRQAIIWTNAGILLIRTLGTNFSEILGEIHSFSFKNMPLEMSSAKWHLFGLGLNELIISTWTSAMAWCLFGAKSPARLIIARTWNQYYTWTMHFYTDAFGRYLFRTIFIIILWGSLTESNMERHIEIYLIRICILWSVSGENIRTFRWISNFWS